MKSPTEFLRDGKMVIVSGENIEFNVMEYHPTPDGSGPPSEVHLVIGFGESAIMLAFKGPAATATYCVRCNRWREQVPERPRQTIAVLDRRDHSLCEHRQRNVN